MLQEALENVLPYITNISKLKEFVKNFEGMDVEEIKENLERKIEYSEGTLKTDFRILLNEIEKTINKKM